MTDVAQAVIISRTYEIGTGLDGAVGFHLHLIYNSQTHTVTGMGVISQAVNPPVHVATKLEGTFATMLILGVPNTIVTATGILPFLGQQGSSNIVLPVNVQLHMVLDTQLNEGTASYKYTTSPFDGPWVNVPDVPVRPA